MATARALGRVASVLLLAALTTTSAVATQIEHRTLERLSSEAGLVVQGRVTGTRSFWNEERTRILTEIEISVDRSYKGRAPDTVRVLQMGGTVDGVKMTVHGALQWQPDAEVLVFLEPSLPSRYRVSGFSQGRFDLERDARTGETIAVRPVLAGAEIVGGESSALRLPLRELLAKSSLAFGEVR